MADKAIHPYPEGAERRDDWARKQQREVPQRTQEIEQRKIEQTQSSGQEHQQGNSGQDQD